MNLQPICPSPYTSSGSPFTAMCAKCKRQCSSTSSAADLDGPAGTFVCWFCMDEQTQDRVRLASATAFDELSDVAKHHARLLTFGPSMTREIEARVRVNEYRRGLR